MKILSNKIDNKSLDGFVVLTPTNAEDFYILSDIVEEGDVAEASTTRKLSMDGGRTQQKINLCLAIKIEKVEYDLQDCIMSFKGKICKENEHIQQGSYHTIHITIGEKLELYKKHWSRKNRGSLQHAAKDVPQLCFILFYDKECVISMVSSNDIKNLYKAEIKNKNYKPMISNLIGIKNTVKAILVGGFSSVAEDFHKVLLKEDKSFEKLTTVVKIPAEYKNLPNSKVVSRLLTDKMFSKIFSEIKYVEDLKEVESFFGDFAKGSKKICLGYSEIKEAFEYGAIKIVFITDALYRPRTIDERKKIEKLVNEALDLRARICVIPVAHELGEKLKAMGGLAGTLSFSYK